MPIDKYVGKMINIIYVDSKGKFTKRCVNLYAVRNGKARVFDVEKRAFRTLIADRILAAAPVRLRSA